MSSNENILTKMHDFLKALIPVIDVFPRDARFRLGKRIESLAIETYELLIDTYYGPRKNRRNRLYTVNLSLEKLRLLLRLAFELKYLSNKQLGNFSAHLLEIGKMTGGWIKSLDN